MIFKMKEKKNYTKKKKINILKEIKQNNKNKF